MGKIMFILTMCSFLLTGCGVVDDQQSPIEPVIEPIIEKSGEVKPSNSSDVKVIATYDSTIEEDSTWCPTFQLVWNDMKNEVVKQDIVFMPEQSPVAEMLNKESFTENMLSDEYYYKTFGFKTLELKKKIEKGVKDKFNETSDILNDFDWSPEALNDYNNPNVSRYFFYTMLKRNFVFPKVFEKLQNGTFGSNKENTNVKYFGIERNKDNEYSDQVRVLFYDGDDAEYAVLLKTKSGDEVILYKSPCGATFQEIYKNIQEKSNNFTGKTRLQDIDTLKVPYINIDEKETYPELTNKQFLAADGDVCEIAQAVQTIKFELDEKGGKIKSEAAIDMVKATAVFHEELPTPRHFNFDDTFALFLKEEGRDVPYFGAVISDITKFQ